MWWCCGKRGIDAPGCKFSKHESKDDFDEEEQQRRHEKEQKKLRCICCKELGHRIEQCPRDPNYKTMAPCELEQERIMKIKDFRKLHADTVVNTTHFIMKSVMIPLQVDDDGN